MLEELTIIQELTLHDKPWFDEQYRAITGMLLASSRRLIFGGPVITLRLTGKSLFAVKGELMKPTWRPSVSIVTETGLFL